MPLSEHPTGPGVKLMIGLQRRFDPNFLRVRQAIENKEVGDPIIVSIKLIFVFGFSAFLLYENVFIEAVSVAIKYNVSHT